ncbi:MAG TPA: hypothetical protein VN937_18995 [Blastocatellia bacterium]|nr:hypothetical protein [Blastocatellia bacterium]
MSFEAHRSTLRLSTTLCLIGSFLLVVPAVFATDLQKDKDDSAVTARVSPAHSDAPAPAPAIVMSSTVSGNSQSDDQSNASNSPPSGNSQPASPTPSAVAPLTSHQKFTYFARSSFWSPTPYALSVLSGVFGEATDKDHGRHMTAGDFAADSMTHAARSFAFRSTAGFFEKFAFASAFKQDPRYFRSDKKGFARIGYAVSRIFVTQGDNGNNQFNSSFLAGGLVTAGISNLWSRPEDQTVSSTFSRFGTHVAYRALSNIIKELFGKR